jgi:hypothetical protein
MVTSIDELMERYARAISSEEWNWELLSNRLVGGRFFDMPGEAGNALRRLEQDAGSLPETIRFGFRNAIEVYLRHKILVALAQAGVRQSRRPTQADYLVSSNPAELGRDFHVLVQCEVGDNRIECRAFAREHTLNPCLIAIATDGTTKARECALELYAAVTGELSNLLDAVDATGMPGDGNGLVPFVVQSRQSARIRKLLILVTGGSKQLQVPQGYRDWLAGDSGGRFPPDLSYGVMPVVPGLGFDWDLLSPEISRLNVAFWTEPAGRLVPDVLALAGISAADFRVFLSYRRGDGSRTAERLYHALSEQRFEVFLDRFDLPPTIDFVARLRQEILDKSMVVAIESATFTDSEWTMSEVDAAIGYRLGLLAVTLPGGKEVPGIPEELRLRLQPGEDCDRGGDLTSDRLAEIVARVRSCHERALVHRREYLRDAMTLALTAEKIPCAMGLHGTLGCSNGSREYRILPAPRPPAVDEFMQADDAARQSGARGIVVGPTVAQERERLQRLHWLSARSQIALYDEGEMKQAAGDIRRNTVP